MHLVVIGLAIVAGTAALTPRPTSAQSPAAQAAPSGGFSPIGSILEVMLQIVDPYADAIFESVSVVITQEGEKETRPQTEEDWLEVRGNALILAESGNLLKIPRPVSPAKPAPGIAFEPPGPDDLSPAQVEQLLKRDRRAFDAFAQGLTDAALIALRAADARSVDGLYEAGDAIDQACENCHSTYWYPAADSPVRKTLK
jgi:hypothetical protein